MQPLSCKFWALHETASVRTGADPDRPIEIRIISYIGLRLMDVTASINVN